MEDARPPHAEDSDASAERSAEDGPRSEPSPAASNESADERAGAERPESAEPDGLHHEAAAPDVDWARENDRLSRDKDEGLHSLGEDPDDPNKRGRIHAAGGRTGAKVAAGPGSLAAERIQAFFTGTLPNQARAGCLPAEVIESSVITHVPTGEHGLLRDTLLRHNVAYLSGQDGTGRFATVRAVLAELCGSDKVVAIDLNEDAAPAAVLDQADVLRRGHGHLLELAANQPAPRKQTLAAAGGRLAGDQGYLIVIGPAGPADRALDPYEVPHQPPAAVDVLDRHLNHLLRTRAGWSEERAGAFVSVCRADPAVAEHLRTSWQPGEVVLLARRLLEVGQRGGRPPEALEHLPGALRELAATVLRGAEGDANTLRRLTARIAFAVYQGSPLTVVFELASRLFAELPPEDPPPPPLVRTVFDGGIESLVDPRMRARPDEEWVARLVDPELAGAVLDVVWHGYDHVREPLLAWLRALGGDHRERIRMRAGQIAGQLAIYDFGRVYRELLRPWAVSPRKVCHQAVSWAMERALLEPRLTGRVCRQVRDWVYSPDPFLNDTAARCFATRIGTEFADDALVHLYLVAVRGEQVGNPAVAQAVAQLYLPDQLESGHAVLTELAHWVCHDQRCLQVHAARALTFIAHRTAPQPNERWPALLRLAHDDAEAWDLLVTLWQTALTEPMTAARGWDVLLAWLLRADERDELDDVIARFATDLLGTPPVRSRALFHLTQWLPRYPDISIVRRLHDNFRKDES